MDDQSPGEGKTKPPEPTFFGARAWVAGLGVALFALTLNQTILWMSGFVLLLLGGGILLASFVAGLMGSNSGWQMAKAAFFVLALWVLVMALDYLDFSFSWGLFPRGPLL